MIRHRTTMLLSATLAGAALAAPALAQTILQGPVYSAVTRTRYIVVNAPDWFAARQFAQSLGGDLATIESASENNWITANLTAGGSRKLFLGLNDSTTEGDLRWADGSTAPYRNWANTGPNNTATNDFTMLSGATGEWSLQNSTWTPEAVIELNGPLRVPAEFPTIAAAIAFINAAPNTPAPFEIALAAGTHTINDIVTIAGKKVWIRGTGVLSEIRRTNTQRPVFIVSNAGELQIEDARVRDTVAGGSALFRSTEPGGAVTLRRVIIDVTPSGSSPVFQSISPLHLDSCLIARANVIFGSFGLLRSDVTAVNTIFADCGMITQPESEGRLTAANCTFHNIPNGSPTMIEGNWDARIANSLFSNISVFTQSSKTFITRSMVPQPLTSGVGNIVGAPSYIDPDLRDFRLRPGSPAIDAGSIDEYMAVGPRTLTDFAGLPRFVDVPTAANAPGVNPNFAIDMGAHEFPFTPCPADFNNDGVADFFDYLDFVQAFDAGC